MDTCGLQISVYMYIFYLFLDFIQVRVLSYKLEICACDK